RTKTVALERGTPVAASIPSASGPLRLNCRTVGSVHSVAVRVRPAAISEKSESPVAAESGGPSRKGSAHRRVFALQVVSALQVLSALRVVSALRLASAPLVSREQRPTVAAVQCRARPSPLPGPV